MDEKDILRRLKEDGERIEIPEELRPEKIEKMLASVRQMQETWEEKESGGKQQEELNPDNVEKEEGSASDRNRRDKFGNGKLRRYTRRIAAAAVVLLFIGGAYGTSRVMDLDNRNVLSGSAAESVKNGNGKDAATEAEEDSSSKGIISVAKVGDMYTRAGDYEEVYDKLDENREKWYEKLNIWDTLGNIKDAEDIAVSEGTANGVVESGESDVFSAADLGYSKTNLVTAGVDESDIIKTDGKYIYMRKNNQVVITDIRNGGLKEAAAVRPPMNSASGRILEMYVDEEQLIVITQEEKTKMSSSRYDEGASASSASSDEYNSYDVYQIDSDSCTIAYIYDISNPAEPKLEDTIEQDGVYHTSRKIGSILYLFTDYSLNLPEGRKKYAVSEEGIKDWIPSVNEETISADCIYLPEQGNSSLLVSSADVAKKGKIIDMKMIVSAYVDIYVSNSSIFLYEVDYSNAQSYTRIAKFAMDKGLIQGVDAASVRGEVQDTFAINEYQGYLRVLTTDWQDGRDVNEVYVLDSDMRLAGELSGIAPGELIYSARFLKDTGYFVTYRNTDPLFTVDFSEPENPRITGELKVTGFSEYLHFWGENRLLGIGYETNPETGEQIGVKLSMFDISDPSDVKEESKLVLKGVDYSPALYEYKCVLADSEKNLIGFAVESYGEYGTGRSYQVFSYENGVFIRKLEEKLNDFDDLSGYRGLYAGKYFYLAGEQAIRFYDMEQEFLKMEQ